jgi:hypothetical protein
MATGRLLGNEATTTAALRFTPPFTVNRWELGPPQAAQPKSEFEKKKTIRRLTRSLSFSL